MEAGRESENLTEIFGYLIPGYLLIVVIVGLLGLSSFFPTFFAHGTLLAALVAVSGLPVGFTWVYGIYHPLVWKNSRCGKDWNRFVNHIGRQMLLELDENGDLPVRVVSNLKILNDASNDDTGPLFNLVDRLFVGLREKYPFLAFFHVRHHTLRNMECIFAIGSMGVVIDIILTLEKTKFVWSGHLTACMVGLILLVPSALACWKAAGNSYKTTKITYGLRFAADWVEVKSNVRSMLDVPYSIFDRSVNAKIEYLSVKTRIYRWVIQVLGRPKILD